MSDPISAPAPPASTADRSWRRTVLRILTAAALLAGLIFRLDNGLDDLWVDELHTAWVAHGDWSEVASRAAIGNQAPLYFYITKCVTSLFGLSEFTLRLPALLAGMTLCVTAGWWVKRETGDGLAALIALFCVAFDRTCILYSSEARPYALQQLVLAFLLISTLQADGRWKGFWIRSLLAAAAMHLQLTSILFLAAIYAARCVQVVLKNEERRAAALAFLAEAALAGLLIAPLAPLFLEVSGRRDAWRAFVPTPTIFAFFTMFPWGPALLALAAAIYARNVEQPTAKFSLLMGLTWAGTVPALLAMILDWLGVASLFLRRYLLGDFWPILVLPGLFLTYLRGRPKQFVAIGVVFLSLLMNAHWAPQRWKVGRLTPSRREAWRRAVDQVRKVDPNGELPLFLVPGLIESRRLASDPDPLLREYLASPISTLYKVPHAAKDVIPLSSVTPAAPSAEIVEQVARRGGALWLIRISPQHADAWRRYALQLRQELKSQSQDEWLLREFVKPGIVILELRCAVR